MVTLGRTVRLGNEQPQHRAGPLLTAQLHGEPRGTGANSRGVAFGTGAGAGSESPRPARLRPGFAPTVCLKAAERAVSIPGCVDSAARQSCARRPLSLPCRHTPGPSASSPSAFLCTPSGVLAAPISGPPTARQGAWSRGSQMQTQTGSSEAALRWEAGPGPAGASCVQTPQSLQPGLERCCRGGPGSCDISNEMFPRQA